MQEPPQLPWECTHSEPGPEILLFKARYNQMRNPRNGATLKTLVLEGNDWVNVAAITPEGNIIIVRQFRFGTGRTTAEFPAGLVETDEAPLAAAQRELAEETGYTTEDWVSLGSVDANAAFLNNQCHLFVARNVVKTAETHLDPSEDILVEEISLEQLKAEIESGQFSNSMSVLTAYKVFDLR